VAGTLSLSEDGKEVVLSSSEDDFVKALDVVKEGLVDRARLVRRQAKLQDNGVKEFERRLGLAETEEAKAAAEAQIKSRTLAYEKLIADADDLIARSEAPGGTEKIGKTEPSFYVMDAPEVSRKASDNQVVWLETLVEKGAVESVFNKRFFTTGDSREPELAGLWGAIVGSFWTMLVTFIIAFPIGVLTAIYLEEFAPKTLRWWVVWFWL